MQQQAEDTPIEIETEHRCRLAAITQQLATLATDGIHGRSLAGHALSALDALDSGFESCCLPAYLALAPERFDCEIQLPVASAGVAGLDTRVLLWPVGAQDRQHPHRDGWAAFMVVRGALAESQQRHGERLPERALRLHLPQALFPADGVSHHIHNRGDEIGLTIHIFGT
jgi:hypothetical protein